MPMPRRMSQYSSFSPAMSQRRSSWSIGHSKDSKRSSEARNRKTTCQWSRKRVIVQRRCAHGAKQTDRGPTVKLDRNINKDGKGKYALVLLREFPKNAGGDRMDVEHALHILRRVGMLD